jgi:hypothetical protein
MRGLYIKYSPFPSRSLPITGLMGYGNWMRPKFHNRSYRGCHRVDKKDMSGKKSENEMRRNQNSQGNGLVPEEGRSIGGQVRSQQRKRRRERALVVWLGPYGWWKSIPVGVKGRPRYVERNARIGWDETERAREFVGQFFRIPFLAILMLVPFGTLQMEVKANIPLAMLAEGDWSLIRLRKRGKDEWADVGRFVPAIVPSPQCRQWITMYWVYYGRSNDCE